MVSARYGRNNCLEVANGGLRLHDVWLSMRRLSEKNIYRIEIPLFCVRFSFELRLRTMFGVPRDDGAWAESAKRFQVRFRGRPVLDVDMFNAKRWVVGLLQGYPKRVFPVVSAEFESYVQAFL